MLLGVREQTVGRAAVNRVIIQLLFDPRHAKVRISVNVTVRFYVAESNVEEGSSTWPSSRRDVVFRMKRGEQR